MASEANPVQVGRLFLRALRTRGPGLRFRLLHRDNPGVEVWVARWMLVVAIVHRRGCGCEDCRCEREMYGGGDTP